MENLLVKLMLVAALLQFGISVSDLGKCHSRTFVQTLEKRSRDVLKINWKPISVFPNVNPNRGSLGRDLNSDSKKLADVKKGRHARIPSSALNGL